MVQEEKAGVVVLSRTYAAALGAVRDLGAAGYPVDLVFSAHQAGDGAVAMGSRYVRTAVEVVADKKDKEEVLTALLNYAEQQERKMVLYPADGYAAKLVKRNYEELETVFELPFIAEEAGEHTLKEYGKRSFQKELAESVGFSLPVQWEIRLAHAEEFYDTVTFPCICKGGKKVSGYKATLCRDVEELEKCFKALRDKKAKKAFVQEVFENGVEWNLSGVCLDQKVIIPGVFRKDKTALWKANEGAALTAQVVPFDAQSELGRKVIRMLQTLRYVGMFNVKLIVTDDAVYFEKLDLRGGAQTMFYSKCGVNLPVLCVKSILGESISEEEMRISEYGKSYVYEKTVWEDFIHNCMTQEELDGYLQDPGLLVLHDAADEEPGERFDRNMQELLKETQQKQMKKRMIRTLKKIAAPVVRPVKKALRRVRKLAKRVLRKGKRFAFRWLRRLKYVLLGYPQAKKKNRRDPQAEKARVMVVGRNYCSNLGMARAMGKAGYEVEVLRIFGKKPSRKNLLRFLKPDAYSRYVKAYHVCVTQKKNERIIKKLKSIADPNHKMLLMPMDDLVANTVDEHLEELLELYRIPNVGEIPGEIDRLMSKEVQKQLAREAGLPVVNSCVIVAKKGGHFTIPETVAYPCFIKPNISKDGLKSRMRKCENEAELREALTALSAKKTVEMLVEDFVEIDHEYSILGVSTKEATIGPGYFKAMAGGHNERRGIALNGVVVPVEEEEALIRDLVKFVHSLGYVGLYDIDLIKTTSGKMYFVELNLRFGGSGYSITKSGTNLPGMFADYMILNKPIDANCHMERVGLEFVNEKILLEEYIKGFYTMQEAKAIMKQADIHFLADEEDTRPYRHFRKFFYVGALMRLAFKIKAALKK